MKEMEDSEKFCHTIAGQIFLDLSSIESKENNRDTFNDFLNMYVFKNLKHFENAGQFDDFDDIMKHYFLSDAVVMGKLGAMLKKQSNHDQKKILLEANDLIRSEMYQENEKFIIKYFG